MENSLQTVALAGAAIAFMGVGIQTGIADALAEKLVETLRSFNLSKQYFLVRYLTFLK